MPSFAGMGVSNIIFAACLVVALAFFTRSARRLARWLKIGHPEDRTNEARPSHQKPDHHRISAEQDSARSVGRRHARLRVLGLLRAWPWAPLEIMIQGLWTGFNYGMFLPNFLYTAYVASQELFAVFVLIPVAFLLYRRLVIKPRRFHVDPVHGGDAIFILSMIAALMVSLADHVRDGSASRRRRIQRSCDFRIDRETVLGNVRRAPRTPSRIRCGGFTRC